jgi:hypothetical protein
MNKQDDPSNRDRPQELDPGAQRDFESKRVPLERVVMEVLRRGLGVGRDTLKQTDEALRSVSDTAFAKDAASHMVSQIGDLRQGISKVVAKEVERYLGRIDLASELRKALDGMTIEGNIKIKFKDSEQEQKGEDPKKK